MDASEPIQDPTRERGGSSRPAPSRRQEIPEFTDLVFACRHQPLRVAVIGMVLSVTLVWIAWMATHARYRAEGLVRVRQEQDVIFAAQTSRSSDHTFFHSQEQLALSPQVLAAALEQEDVRALGDLVPQEEPIEWLRSQLKVDMQSGSEVMTIAAINDSPRLAYTLANAVTQAYLAEVTNRLDMDRSRRERELEIAAKEADQRLDELWSQLNSVAQSVGTDNSQSLTIRDELQLQAYRDYSRQLQTAQIRGNELETQFAAAKRRQEQEDNQSVPVTDAMVQNDPEVIVAKQRVASLRAQREEMRQIVADLDSPRMKRVEQDLEFYEADLQTVIQNRTAALKEQIRQQSETVAESSLIELQQQLDRNRAEKEFLRQRLSEIDTGIARSDDKTGVQLEMWRHAIQRQTGLADQVWHSLQELRIERQSQPRVKLIELADVPTRADHSRQLKAAGAAGLLGWMLAVLGVGFVEWSECRVRFPEDLTSRFVFPVYGKESGGSLNRKAANRGAREAAAQMMLLNQNGHSIPTLMVSSATASEPRHLAATELARALCKFHRRTLLIDADASGNRLSRALGAERLAGLRQLPSGSDARHLIIPSEEEQLDFLSIGPREDDDNWVDPESLGHVIESMRHHYQAIVVNGPAMLSTAESLLLASQVDVLLMTVQVATSRWNQLAVAAESLVQAGIRIGGCILMQSKRGKKLQLQPDRQGDTLSSVDEERLRDQIDEMKRALDQARNPNDNKKSTSPERAPENTNQESAS